MIERNVWNESAFRTSGTLQPFARKWPIGNVCHINTRRVSRYDWRANAAADTFTGNSTWNRAWLRPLRKLAFLRKFRSFRAFDSRRSSSARCLALPLNQTMMPPRHEVTFIRRLVDHQRGGNQFRPRAAALFASSSWHSATFLLLRVVIVVVFFLLSRRERRTCE